jgi:hypothetical protein
LKGKQRAEEDEDQDQAKEEERGTSIKSRAQKTHKLNMAKKSKTTKKCWQQPKSIRAVKFGGVQR